MSIRGDITLLDAIYNNTSRKTVWVVIFSIVAFLAITHFISKQLSEPTVIDKSFSTERWMVDSTNSRSAEKWYTRELLLPGLIENYLQVGTEKAAVIALLGDDSKEAKLCRHYLRNRQGSIGGKRHDVIFTSDKSWVYHPNTSNIGFLANRLNSTNSLLYNVGTSAKGPNAILLLFNAQDKLEEIFVVQCR